MLRWTKWATPMAAVVLMLGLNTVRADDAAPAGKATVTVTVVDAAGKPVAGADVSLMVAKAKKVKGAPTTQPEGVKPAKPTPLETGTTGADGTVALAKVPDGDFTVAAKAKGEGAGRAKVIVVEGKDTAVSITLKAKKAKGA